ncbi:hypothetical protein FQN60_011302 [Etheostoma spectabile]|uniref:Uncharacterized protein n=1 Tax=Etheostoma spectabile TaxID=54343 RepID=A0A5J5DRU0_9PERO|nr:hypothetical protein FQN60_011302 [Etheostoma spectabile]
MKRGAAFCQVPRLLLSAEPPTMLSIPPPLPPPLSIYIFRASTKCPLPGRSDRYVPIGKHPDSRDGRVREWLCPCGCGGMAEYHMLSIGTYTTPWKGKRDREQERELVLTLVTTFKSLSVKCLLGTFKQKMALERVDHYDVPGGQTLPLANLGVRVGAGGDGVLPIDKEDCSSIVHDGGVAVGYVLDVGGLLVGVIGHLRVEVLPFDPEVHTVVAAGAPGLFVLGAQSGGDLVLDDAAAEAALPVERDYLTAPHSAQ